jgi:putative transposase
MGRARRVDVGGVIYHALNRANFASRLFRETAHDADFLGMVEDNFSFVPMRLLAYWIMPNLWHLVLYPRADGGLWKFLRRITLSHTPAGAEPSSAS